MAFCSKCGTQVQDGAPFCPNCGAPMGAPGQAMPNYAPAPIVPEWDHTGEFDPRDISENKVFALATYLLGFIGIIIVFLGAKESKYAMWHAKNALTLEVVAAFVALATAVLSWTCIVPVAGAVCIIIIAVLEIICIFNVFAGKAKEPAIIRGLSFLK